jgi:hypothetical protein
MAIDPRIRNSAGQFSAKGELTARAIRKAWSIAPRRSALTKFSSRVPITVELEAVSSSFTADRIDKTNGVLRGVSLMTAGIVARGHSLVVDAKTLDQVKTCLESKGRVPVRINHKSGAENIVGFISDPFLEGSKLKGDLYLLSSHPQRDQILEVASRMPEGVGLSASFVAPDKPEAAPGGMAAARCEELLGIDYVCLPAANPDGLFSAKLNSPTVDSPTSPMNPEILAAIKAAIAEAVAPLSEQVALLQKQNEQANNEEQTLTLEEAAGMSEAELAALGLTPADVQEALEAAAQAEAAGQEQIANEGELVAPNGEAAPAEAAATAAPAATGLEALTKLVTELSAEIKSLKGQKVVDAETKLVDSIEKNFDALVEENARLKQAIEAGGQPAKPGVDRNNVKFFSANKEQGEFENLVQLGIEEKKLSKSQAFTAVIKENPTAYNDYLVRLGVRKPSE